MKNFRDIEQLSSYLDGQLNPSDSARIESRISSDPELASVYNDLRAARGILRKLPARKAPRNFTLTRQMVGLKPPLPRSYPLIRFATVFASVLFLLSFTATALSPIVSFSGAAAPAPALGMGGGCQDCEGAPAQEAAAATEAPATEEAFAAEMAPAATDEPPAADTAPSFANTNQPEILPTEGARIVEPTPSLKEPEQALPTEESAAETAKQPQVESEPPSSFNWTLLFFIGSVAGVAAMWTMRLYAKRKWR